MRRPTFVMKTKKFSFFIRVDLIDVDPANGALLFFLLLQGV